jgi:predicted GNAT superfamily acetyltransferase
MSHPSAAPEIEVRPCSSLGEYEECLRIGHATWGEDLAVPSGLFVVARHTGGQTIGAFHGPRLAGFTLAFAGVRDAKPFLHSHMTTVLPEYQDRGVGRRLKLFQRQDALKRGFALIEWTFDPLEPKNAHFNLVSLGAIARRYRPNCYGITATPLHAGLPTDRLVAEWWLDSERVKSILADNFLPATAGGPAAGPAGRITLPLHIAELKSNDRAAAQRVQSEARAQFQRAFASGYVAAGIETDGDGIHYLLESAAAIAGLRLQTIAED